MLKKLFLAFLFICITFTFISCSKQNTEIKIGAVLPLTGDLSLYGQKSKKGTDLALELLNKNGGIDGKKVDIIYEDDRSNSSVAVNATQKLISIDKVQAIIGAVSSSTTLSIIPVINNAKVVLFSPASSSPKLSGASPYFFRNWPSDVAEASFLANFAFDSLKLKNIGILYADNDYGLGLKNKFQTEFEKRGGNIVLSQSYPLDARDFKTLILKLKSKHPDAVFLGGYKEMGIITKQLRQAKVNIQILACTNYGDKEILSLAGNSAEGAIYGTPVYDPSQTNLESVSKFAKYYEKKYNQEPSLFEANGFDAVNIICDAIKKIGNDGTKIKNYIGSLKNYDGGAGIISFNKDGDVIRKIGLKIVKNNKFVNY